MSDEGRGLIALLIEGAYPGQVNGWYLADLILEAGFRLTSSPPNPSTTEGDD